MKKAKVLLPVLYRGYAFEVGICYDEERKERVLEAYGGRVDIQESLARPRTDSTVRDRQSLWRVAFAHYIRAVQRDREDWPELVRDALQDLKTAKPYTPPE